MKKFDQVNSRLKARKVKSSAFRKKRQSKKRRAFKRKLWLYAGLVIFLLLGSFFFFKIWPLVKDLPSPEELTEGNERFSVASQLYDRHGQIARARNKVSQCAFPVSCVNADGTTKTLQPFL